MNTQSGSDEKSVNKPTQIHKYDFIPCDYCGKKIMRGCVKFHTGQLVHHGCDEKAAEKFFGEYKYERTQHL